MLLLKYIGMYKLYMLLQAEKINQNLYIRIKKIETSVKMGYIIGFNCSGWCVYVWADRERERDCLTCGRRIELNLLKHEK